MKARLQPTAPSAQQADGDLQIVHRRCYTAKQIIAALQISTRAFFAMKRRGELPFLEVLRPQLGRTVRYRADLVDRYLSGQWGGVSHGRHVRATVQVPGSPQFRQ
jgi:hypothetical protein